MNEVLKYIFNGMGFIIETQVLIDSNDVYIKANNFLDKDMTPYPWTKSKPVQVLEEAANKELILRKRKRDGSTWFHISLLFSFVQWNNCITSDKKTVIISRMLELANAGILKADGADYCAELEDEIKGLQSKLSIYEDAVLNQPEVNTLTQEDFEAMGIEIDRDAVEITNEAQDYKGMAALYRDVLGDTTIVDFVEWKANN